MSPLALYRPIQCHFSTVLLLFAGVSLADLNRRSADAAPSTDLTLYAIEDSWVDAEHTGGNHGADSAWKRDVS